MTCEVEESLGEEVAVGGEDEDEEEEFEGEVVDDEGDAGDGEFEHDGVISVGGAITASVSHLSAFVCEAVAVAAGEEEEAGE